MKPHILLTITLILLALTQPAPAQEKSSKKEAAPTAATDAAPDPATTDTKADAPPVSPELTADHIVRVYTVPRTFAPSLTRDGQRTGGASIDPFASDDPAINKKRRTLRSHLEDLGITFGKGASVTYDHETLQVVLHNTPSQHQLFEAYLQSLVASGERQLHLLLEYIEVEQEDFSQWILDNKLALDATPMRKTIQEWIDDRDAYLVQSSILTARSGQRGKVESIREYIYPTEYDPPEIPNEVTLSGRATSPVTSITPTAFETRHLGHTFEIDPVIDSDGHTIYLNLAPELVEHQGYTHWPSEDADPLFRATQPTFYTQKITTQIVVTDGRYGFLGTTRPRQATNKRIDDPIILQFIRADIGNVVEYTVTDSDQPAAGEGE